MSATRGGGPPHRAVITPCRFPTGPWMSQILAIPLASPLALPTAKGDHLLLVLSITIVTCSEGLMIKLTAVPIALALLFVATPSTKVPESRLVPIAEMPDGAVCHKGGHSVLDTQLEKISRERFCIVDKSGLRVAIEGRLKWLGLL